jgi:alanine-glyoxylate transaminase/serine-glyoxylate transaminase/serine-pyruvate transaminase
MSRSSGRHFLQIPGPTNTPLSILAAIAKPTIDHRGPEFAGLGLDVLKRIRSVFKTEGPVIIYPTFGTGAWEAALAMPGLSSCAPGMGIDLESPPASWSRRAE